MRSSIIAAAVLLLCLGVFPRHAHGEQQFVPLATAGWHFISFQVQPRAATPADVFGQGYYDHVWTYDQSYGWFHYSPITGEFNDLDQVEAFRGYWIHLTAGHPQGGIRVDGDRPPVYSLSGPGWHATGVFRGPGHVTDAYAPLDANVLSAAIAEIWQFDRNSDGFRRIFLSDGGLSVCPGADCLQEGVGYWLLANEPLVIGQEITSTTECVTISPGSRIAEINIKYRGADQGVAMLRQKNLCVESGAAITCARGATRCCSFDPTRACMQDSQCPQASRLIDLFPQADEMESIDGNPVPRPDLTRSRSGGPDTCAEGLCNGGSDCTGVCFASATSGMAGSQDGERSYKVYASIPESQFLSLGASGTFSTCDQPYTSFVLEQTPSAGASARTSMQPLVRRVIKVAVQPPIVDGAYSGSLTYLASGVLAGSVPLHLFFDSCTVPEGSEQGGPRQCDTGRVTAVINPRILGSTSNGIDDDGDGTIDDAGVSGEGGVIIPIRTALSFPREMVLHGSLSQDQRFIRFAGTGALPGLAFANRVSDVVPEDAGIASLFVGTERALTFEGFRSDLETFQGIFSETYFSRDGTTAPLSADGTFQLARVVGPRCIARDFPENPAHSTVQLGSLCQSDANCPRRCVYHDLISQPSSGIPCLSADDCPSICVDASNRVVDCSKEHAGGPYPLGDADDRKECKPYPCGFISPAPGSETSRAREHGGGTLIVSVPTPPAGTSARHGVVELVGAGLPASGRLRIDSSDPSIVAFDDLPCGVYQVRILVDGCEPRLRTIYWCGVSSCQANSECPDGWSCSGSPKKCQPPAGLYDGYGDRISLTVDASECPTKYCEIGRSVCEANRDCTLGLCIFSNEVCDGAESCHRGICLAPTAEPPPMFTGDTLLCSEDADCAGRSGTICRRFCHLRERCLTGIPAPPKDIDSTMAPDPPGRQLTVTGGMQGVAAQTTSDPRRFASKLNGPGLTLAYSGGVATVGGLNSRLEFSEIVTDVDQHEFARTGLLPALKRIVP